MPETKAKSLLIDNNKCITCGICASLCPHDALTIVDRIPEVTGKCRVCGLCASSCPSKAITMAAKKFRDESLVEEIDGDIVVFSCRRIKKTVDACVVSLLCSSRIDISLIADAFVKGAKCVIVSTCGKDCRNYPGSEEAKSKVEAFKRILKAIGESEERILLVEGDFAEAVESMKGRFTEKVEKADLLKSITLNRDLRALIAKMRSITEEGNAYGERIPSERFEKILDDAIERAMKISMIMKNLDGGATVSELVEKTSMSYRDVMDTILEMKKRNLVEIDVGDELIVKGVSS